MVTKIFELDQSILSISLDYGTHELIDEIIISFSSDSLMPGSDIIFILEEALIIGANICKALKCWHDICYLIFAMILHNRNHLPNVIGNVW